MGEGAIGVVDGWLHPGDPRFSGRMALAAQGPGGWTETSYGDLDVASARVADRLAGLGVGSGDRVVIARPTGDEWVVALFGAWRQGAVAVPVDPRLAPDDVHGLVERTRGGRLVSGPPGACPGATPGRSRP